MGSEGVGKSGICFTESIEGMFTVPRHRSQVTARDLRWSFLTCWGYRGEGLMAVGVGHITVVLPSEVM